MSKNYLKYLESSCNKLKNEKIFDIVIYGSFARGKTDFNDVDLMIIFIDVSLKERTEIAQSLKSILKKEISNIDVKTMNLKDIFDEAFFARQGLLVEGMSLVKDKPLAELMGFKGFSIFTYNLKNLNHNKKTQFTYALIGRNTEGVVKSLGGIPLGRGAIQVPIESSSEFESFLQKWGVNYKIKKILESKS